MMQHMLPIWSLVPLPFLNPAWTSGSSWFTYCLSLAWRILSITLLAGGECNCAVVYTHNMLKRCQLSKKRSKRLTWEISAPETDPIPLSVPCSNIWLSTTFSAKGKQKGSCTSKRQIWYESSSFQLPNYVILVVIHKAFWASLEGREGGREIFPVGLWWKLNSLKLG